jgi:hypothetical protein
MKLLSNVPLVLGASLLTSGLLSSGFGTLRSSSPGPQNATPDAQQVTGGSVTGGSANGGRAAPSHLFDRLAASRDQVGRSGRRISMWVENNNVAGGANGSNYRVVRVHEEVFVESEAQNQARAKPLARPRFAVRYLSVEGDGLDASAKALRKAQLDAIEGFSHHFGGFEIRDAELAKRNYRVIEHPTPVVRLGRRMQLYDVLPHDPLKSSYRLLVDYEHDVVVDEVEISPTGMLVRSRFYLTLELGKQLQFPSKTDWWQPWNQVREHVDLDRASQASGVRPRIPNDGVEGYRPFSFRSATHSKSGQNYLVLGYTDGIDVRFLLEAKMSRAQFEKQTGLVHDTANLRVFHCHLGPAPQYFTYSDGMALILVGHFHPNLQEHVSQAGQPKLPEMLVELLR